MIAYKQPVTAPEITEIRGVESAGVLGTLLDRKLITTAGRKQVIGRPILYKTSKQFLLRFGLNELSELPSMEEFEKLAIDGQVELFTPPQTAGADEPEAPPGRNCARRIISGGHCRAARSLQPGCERAAISVSNSREERTRRHTRRPARKTIRNMLENDLDTCEKAGRVLKTVLRRCDLSSPDPTLG